MKTILVFLPLLLTATFAQDKPPVSFWGSVGFGISSFGNPPSTWSKAGNFGLGVRFSQFTVKFKRNVNSEFVVLSTEEQAKSNEFYLGYSFALSTQPSNGDDISHLGIYTGVGSIELLTRGKILPSTPQGQENEIVSEVKTCIPLELSIEFRLSQYFGCSIATVATVGGFTPIVGCQINLIVGYL